MGEVALGWTDGDSGEAIGREAFDHLLRNVRPKLHRYAARMTGSAVDGEDVVQDALLRATEAFAPELAIARPDAWLFRITHNTAMDHLRRRRREAVDPAVEIEAIVDASAAADAGDAAVASLRTFMQLPPTQRGSVILMDVLGYSLEEIGAVLDASVPAVKAALHRGRTRLRELAGQPDERPMPVLAEADRRRLAAYVDRFNARDFDAVRDMLAADVHLDLVARLSRKGRKDVAVYFTNYSGRTDWRLRVGSVDGRPAVIAHDPGDPSATPTYFILLDWDGDRIACIRDFIHAPYAAERADIGIFE